MQAVNYAAANNLMPTSTNTSERTSTGAVSAISASSSTGTIPPRPATSASNVGYQVTAWFPPAAPTSIDDRPSLAHRSKSAIDPSSRPNR
ncbi:hypothetical protein D6C95_03223 [Aureobasidium pullulans]|nr:hypothetical protein D6C95_03223 [Aureobasidium pullulans]